MKTPWFVLTVLIPVFSLLSCMNSPTGGVGDMGGSVDLGGRTAKQHRSVAAACSMTRAPGPAPVSSGTCRSDGDCNDTSQGSNGRCVSSRNTPVCSYDQCFDDSTCMGKVCLCRPAGQATATQQANHCLSQGNCRTDGDCGAGGTCSPSFSTCGSYTGVVAYYCHTLQDSCLDDEDCQNNEGGMGGIGYCKFSPEGSRWICAYDQCVG